MTRAASSGLGLALALVLVPGAAASPAPLRASAAPVPARISFGDVIHARIVVDLETRRVDAGSLHVAAAFTPFTASGAPSVRRSNSGGRTVVTYEYVLSCLTDGCVPRRDGFVFPSANVSAVVDGTRRAVGVRWPRFVVTSRSSEKDAARSTPPFRSDTSLPPIGTAISASLLVGLFAAVAAVLGLAALAALRIACRRPRPARPSLPPLERAIALVRETAREGDEGRRRRALESLARTLQEHGEVALGRETRTLAWSAEPPARKPMDDLAERASHEVAP